MDKLKERLGFSPSALKSTEQQVTELRNVWKKANQKSIKQAERYTELIKFTNSLTDSYANTMRVVIDISDLLNAYNDLLGDISNGLSQLEQTLDTSVSNEDISKLKNLTLDKIDEINNIFKSDFSKISKAITAASTPDSPAAKSLQRTKQSVEEINTQVVRGTLNGGQKRKYKRMQRKS